jgi:hypothetical protein
MELGGFSKEQKAMLSCLLRERHVHGLPQIMILSERPTTTPTTLSIGLDDLLKQYWPEDVVERLNRALLNIRAISRHLGHILSFDPRDYSLFFATNDDEFASVLRHFADRGLVELVSNQQLCLTTEGWVYVTELEARSRSIQSKIAFVAMSFSLELDSVYHGAIAPAVVDAGYVPLRVDLKEFLGDIMDEVIGGIRKSRFVIADVTEQKNGVYYEAGFAQGLGIPVIWTCRSDEMVNVHFDTQQYNHIVWADAESLRKKLVNRIGAVIY